MASFKKRAKELWRKNNPLDAMENFEGWMGGQDRPKRAQGVSSRLPTYEGAGYGAMPGMGPGYARGGASYSMYGDPNEAWRRDLDAKVRADKVAYEGPRVQADPTMGLAAINQVNQAQITGDPLQNALRMTAPINQQQMGNLSNLQAAAEGRVPSAAEIAMRGQNATNIANQYAMAQGVGGAGAAGAMRGAQQQAALTGGQLQQQLGAQRAAEQAQARGMYTGALSGIRDQGLQTGMALQDVENRRAALGMGKGAAYHGMGMDVAGLQLQDQAQRDAMEQFHRNQRMGYAGMDLESRIAFDQAKQNAYLQMYQADRAVSASEAKPEESAVGGFLSGILGGMASDRRLKKDIEPMDDDDEEERSRRTWGPVKPSRWRYKWEGKDTPKRAGVMAQDVEQSPYLRDMVIDTPRGKALDISRAVSAALASSAGFDKRLRRLEEGGKRGA